MIDEMSPDAAGRIPDTAGYSILGAQSRGPEGNALYHCEYVSTEAERIDQPYRIIPRDFVSPQRTPVNTLCVEGRAANTGNGRRGCRESSTQG